MTMNAKREHFTMEDFKKCAQTAGMKRGREKVIVDDVLQVVSKWLDYAQQVGMAEEKSKEVEKNLHLGGFK
jgi:serine/threonine-protein kinase HipA